MIVILAGGWTEISASIKSGKIIKNLILNNYEVQVLDPANGLNKLKQDILDIKPIYIINLIHGYWGEDGYAQHFLDKLQIPYTGPKSYDATISINKHAMRQICEEVKIPIASGGLYMYENYKKHINYYPHLTKPIFGGSSYGIKIINTENEKNSNQYEQYMLCEKYINGPELGVAVLNGKTLGSILIEHEEQIYTVEAKKTDKRVIFSSGEEYKDQNIVKEAKKYAEQLYNHIDGHGIARIDFKLCKKPYFIDYNSIPGMVLIPRILRNNGYSDSEFIKLLLDNANIYKTKCLPKS